MSVAEMPRKEGGNQGYDENRIMCSGENSSDTQKAPENIERRGEYWNVYPRKEGNQDGQEEAEGIGLICHRDDGFGRGQWYDTGMWKLGTERRPGM